MNTFLNQPLMSTHQFHLIMMRSEGPQAQSEVTRILNSLPSKGKLVKTDKI